MGLPWQDGQTTSSKFGAAQTFQDIDGVLETRKCLDDPLDEIYFQYCLDRKK